MNVAEFDFELPARLIAQRPLARRDQSRLLVLDRMTGAVGHRRFSDLPALLRPGDLLVLNDTRVTAARLVGRKASGGRVELLLVERLDSAGRRGSWRCLLKAARKPPLGSRVEFERGVSAEVLERNGLDWRVAFECPSGRIDEQLELIGRMPLPPYIRRDDEDSRDAEDRVRYQTVFAARPGAIAAPTAGLHFTPELLERLRARAVERVSLTLHVGTATFRPVSVERVAQHRIEAERFDLPPPVAEAVAAARQRNGRVVAVGTTVVRALESCAAAGRLVRAGQGLSELFIYPGYGFRVVDAIITNFHLPRSTLLMLVSAFAGRDRVLEAYREAVRAGYRFYSYGDAMLIEGHG